MVLTEIKMESIEAFNMKTASDEFILDSSDVKLTISVFLNVIVRACVLACVRACVRACVCV